MNADWFKWFPTIYRVHTRHLTAEQDGIYRRLIDEYMVTRHPLPNHDGALARISGVSDEVWLASAEIIKSFFVVDGGVLRHKFCDEQLSDQDGRTKTLSEMGRRGAKKRWKNALAEVIENKEENSQAIATPLGRLKPNDSRREGEEKENIYNSLDKSNSFTSEPKNKISFSFAEKKFSGIDEKDFQLWEKAYPATDVKTEISKMEAWLVANPKNKKSNYPRFINNWLAKAQDKAPRVAGSKSTIKFEEQDYTKGLEGFVV